MNKLGTALGGLLLVGALTAPVAFAHYDTGACPPTAGSFNTAPLCFPLPDPRKDKDRVAGWYYTSSNTETSIIGPIFPFARWNGLYDAEVGGLGTCNGSPLDATNSQNEGRIDGNPGLGLVPDGTHGDGGNSAVGHTFGHYSCNGGPGDASNWETAECDDYNQAFAEDLVSVGSIWIGAQCNWGVPITSGNSAPLEDRVAQFAGDVINCPLGGFPDSCTDAIQYADDCIGIDLVSQTQLPSATPNCGGTSTSSLVCGAGSESTIDFGSGDGSIDPAIYPNAGGFNCDELSTASAFPFTQVVATLTPGVGLNVLPATHGWVA